MQREIKLSLFSVIVVVITIMIVMIVVYYMAFHYGQTDGYAVAMQEKIESTPKYPITANLFKKKYNSDDVYARLDSSASLGNIAESNEIPELGTIKRVEEAPVLEEAAEALINDSNNSPKRELLAQDSVDRLKDSMQGGNEQENEKLLGDLVENTVKKNVLLKDKSINEGAGLKKVNIQDDRNKLAKNEPQKIIQKIEEKKVTAPTPVIKSSTTVKTDNNSGGSIPTGWYVQISSSTKQEDANWIVNRLKTSGFEAKVQMAYVNGERYYRVLSGPERSKDVTLRLLSQIAREHVVKGQQPFVKFVR